MSKFLRNQVADFHWVASNCSSLARTFVVAIFICLAIFLFGCTKRSTHQAFPKKEPQANEQKNEIIARQSDSAIMNGNVSSNYPRFIDNIADWAFIGDDLAWILNFQGELLASNNQGTTWSIIGQSLPIGFDCLTFINDQQGWGVGGAGQIWSTHDSGQTWNLLAQLRPIPGVWEYRGSSQIIFKDEYHGWIRDSFTIWRTTDGGQTWEEKFMTVAPLKVAEQPSEAFFLNSMAGWVPSTMGRIFFTKDGGQSWFVTTPAPGLSVSIFFVNERRGWMGGFDSTSETSNGVLFVTNDGGETWAKQTNISPKITIVGIHFINENEGWLLGSKDIGPDKSMGVILHTRDSGHSWESLPNVPKGEYLGKVYFANSQVGWLADNNHVYQTKDGGESWATELSFSETSKTQKSDMQQQR